MMRSMGRRDRSRAVPSDPMNLVIAIVIVALVAGASIAAMLLVRRVAPEGSYFNDGDRAAGVFGVLATGFSVLLGFIVFLAFTSYDTARSGAEEEARIVTQQIETAQLFPPQFRAGLSADLVCYARSVAGVQWDRMEAGTLGDDLNPWSVKLFQVLQTVDPQTPSEQAAYGKWLDERSARDAARGDRIHGAVGVIPDPLWIVLGFISVVIFVFLLFFADSAERAVVQAMLMGSVVSVIMTMLLLLVFLDNPYNQGVGGLRPVAMERALLIIDQELNALRIDIQPPCDEQGNAL
jgi:amino acid transporter